MNEAAEITSARLQLEELARDWRGEVPLRIHASGRGQAWGLGSAPPFSPEFEQYIGKLECKVPDCQECRKENRRPTIYMDGDGNRSHLKEHRQRTTKAFRKLRRAAPLEFDVLYMAVMHGLNIEQITARLNDWSSTKGYETTYTIESVAVLALCGIDKTTRWL